MDQLIAEPARRGRPPRHRREHVLGVAAEVLVYRGYDATRYTDVAQASGVPVASLQHYFPSLNDLLRAAVCHGVRAELDRLVSRVADIDDPWARVDEIIRTTISTDPARRRGGWILWLEYWRAAARDDELAIDAREVRALWVDLAADTIDKGTRAGVFRPVASPRDAARELHALLDGLGIELGMDHGEDEAMAAARTAELAARRLLVG